MTLRSKLGRWRRIVRVAVRAIEIGVPWLLISNAGSAFAQTIARATSPDVPERDTVSLPEFTVTTSRTNDYVAAETITGTRIASKIMELPFNVNVATREFIEDFSLSDLNEQVGYMSSVAQSEGSALPGSGSQSVPVRGFTSDADLRNGFRRLAGTVHNVAIDRVEAIKGPAAGIYGRIQPGGVVNIVTKRPDTRPAHRFAIAVGDHDQYRGEFSSTGPVRAGGNFFHRVDLAADTRGYREKYRDLKVTTASAQLLWKIDARSSVNFELEHTRRNEVPGMFVPIIGKRGTADPYQLMPNGTPSGTLAYFLEAALPLLHFNNTGPGVWADLEMSTATATYELRLSSDWSLRAGLNAFERIHDRQYVSGVPSVQWVANAPAPDYGLIWNGTRFGPDNVARYPDYDHMVDDGYNFQTDLVGAFRTGVVSHKLLMTLDVSYARRDRKDYQMRLSAANNLANNGFAQPIAVASPNFAFRNYRQAPELYGPRANENYENSDDNYGVFVSERASLWSNRLIALAGARYDYVQSVRDRKFVPAGDFDAGIAAGNSALYSEFNNDNVTYQAGLNFALTPSTMLYASHSTSYQPQARVNLAGDNLPNERGEGAEAGVKVSWFENRLNLTTSVYDITRRNLARTMIVDFDTNLRDVFASGAERSKGVEVDFNWQFGPGFQVFGGYGYNDTKVTKNDERPFLIGTTPRRVPHHNAGAGVRYEVQRGRLRGLFLAGGWRYYGSSLALDQATRTLSPNTRVIVNLTTPNGQLLYPQFPEGAYVYRDVMTVNGRQTFEVHPSASVVVDDGRSQVINPAYALAEAAVGYRWRAVAFRGKQLSHRLQLNVKNLADKAYATAALRPGEPRSFLVTYAVSY